jgi:glycosyltransferase involved in cell wall biosynthesis
VKLLMVTHYFESHRSGIELIAGRLIRELVCLEQEVVWVASNATPPPFDDKLGSRSVALNAVNITERYLGIPFPIPSPGAIGQIRREVQCADAVLLQDCLYPMCIAAFLFALLSRKPVVIAQHVGIVPYNNPVFRMIISGIPFRSTPKLMFTGVDTEIFFPIKPEQKLELRARLGLASDRPIALFVGRFVEKKGLHILSRMVRLRPDIAWVFAGWGHLNPRDWNLQNVMVFSDLGGPSIAPLYQASDVFVLPSKGEGFPLVIQEALACGLPVVCSAETAGADAAVSAFLSAVPLDERNPDATALAFCEEIDRALAGDGNGARSREERFQFVSERYCWRTTATKYLELIRSVAANGGDLKQPL